METKKLIYQMLTECTGVHMCDSGGADNRGWQRNQKKTIEDFENEAEQSYEIDVKSMEIYRNVSVFHYLTNNLQINDICEEFNNIPVENWDGNFYGVSDKGNELLENNFDSVSEPFNTYNGKSDLSQILQGQWLKDVEWGEYYLLLQIHNGADVRGGYTDAKLFYCGYEQMIHEYLREYMDSYELKEELEYIDSMVDYWDNTIVYEGKELNKIKTKLLKAWN